MDETDLRVAVRATLHTMNAAVEAALTRELAYPIDLGHSGRLQFEVCPYFYGVKLVQTENEIVEDYAIQDGMPREIGAAADAADMDLHNMIAEELFPWLADRWAAVGGPGRYHPAYLFYHDENDVRWDLEQRRWLSVQEVWPTSRTRAEQPDTTVDRPKAT